jgi:hypothetical protein
MLSTQALLNNLLYDISEVGVPFDNVDAEAPQKSAHWDIKFIERFMLVLGPVSSIFDFLTFFALLTLFGAGATMFQTPAGLSNPCPPNLCHLCHSDTRCAVAKCAASAIDRAYSRRGSHRLDHSADAARSCLRFSGTAARLLPVSHWGCCRLFGSCGSCQRARLSACAHPHEPSRSVWRLF